MFTILPKENIDLFLRKYPIFKEHKDSLLIYNNHYIFPLRFYKNLYCDGMKEWIIDNKLTKKINIKYTGTLRSNQKNIIKILDDYYERNGDYGGVFVASCGFGKTYVSVYLAAMLKTKTMIIVDQITKSKTKNVLENDEWYKAIIATTSLTDNDIGKCFGGKMELDKPIVLATVQTLLSKIKHDFGFIHSKMKEFGFVIYDEAHASSSTINYAKSRLLFTTNNVLAVTATPPKAEINKILFDNTFGKVLHEIKNYKDNPPEIKFIVFDSKLKKDFKQFNVLPRDFKRYVYHDSVITKSKQYRSIILNLNRKILSESQRKVINIIKTTNEKNPQSQSSCLLELLSEFNPTKRYGSYSNLKNTDRCLIAGYKKSHKKFSYDSLTDIVIGFQTSANFNSIEQMIGRVLRVLPDKPIPKVWFLIDKGFNEYFYKNINKIKPVLRELYGKNVKIDVIENKRVK